MSPVLSVRGEQQPPDEQFVGNGNVWPTAVIVKWSILAAIVVFMFTWFIGGYIHARRRIKKGLPPMLYHRFLVREQYQPPRGPQNQATFYRMENYGYNPGMPQQAYGQGPAVPPAYHTDSDVKVDPNQAYVAAPPLQTESQAELPPRPPPQPKQNFIKKINPFK